MKYINLRNIDPKTMIKAVLALVLSACFIVYIINNLNTDTQRHQDVFAYTIKVRQAVNQIDKVFERTEINLEILSDTISYSYDLNKRTDEKYNLKFVEDMNNIIKAVLTNSPNVSGSWFQLNTDLPFSAYAYNWFEFKENQLINLKDKFYTPPEDERKITPEDDPYYFAAIEGKKPSWSDIYTDVETKTSMITLSSPIYKNNLLIGVAGIDISVDDLKQVLKNMRKNLGPSEIYLLNTKNKIIMAQGISNTHKVEDLSFLELLKGESAGPVEYKDNNITKTAIKLNLSNDYKVVIVIKNKVLYQGLNQTVYLIYTLLAIVILLLSAIFVNYYQNSNKLYQTKRLVDKIEETVTAEKDQILN